MSAAEAHDSTTESYEVEVPVYEWVTVPVTATREVPVYGLVPTEVEVQKVREVPVYDFVPTQVPVQKVREVPVYGFVPTEVQVQKVREVPVYDFVPTQVQVQRSRVVPVYNEVTRTVRVAPFRQQVTIQPPCEWATVYGQRVYYCPPPRTSWQDVYNYTTETTYVLAGTRTETYTTTETQMVWTRTGTRTETYTATETKMVRTQTGTRTETYTTTETQMVWTQTGTRSETYTVTETQMVKTQTGTRTETYDTGTTRLVKRETGTRTETRTRTVHTGCPAGYYELDSPDTKAWHTTGGGVTFKTSFLSNHGELVNWQGPLDDNHPNCYTPDQSGIGLSKIVIGGTQYAVKAGKVVIDGVTYAVEAGKIVVQGYANLTETLKAAIVAQLKSALERLDETVVAPICTDLLTGIVVSGAAGLILTQALTTAVAAAGIALPALAVAAVATAAVGALILAGCSLAKPWYTPDAPPTPTGLSLVPADGSLQVSWDASPSKDTFRFGYELSWKRSTQSWNDAKTKTLSDSTTSYRITGLTNNTAYDVTIEAHNLGGTSSEVTATANPAAATPTTTTTTTTTLPETGDPWRVYDTNRNGCVDLDEWWVAIRDHSAANLSFATLAKVAANRCW